MREELPPQRKTLRTRQRRERLEALVCAAWAFAEVLDLYRQMCDDVEAIGRTLLDMAEVMRSRADELASGDETDEAGEAFWLSH